MANAHDALVLAYGAGIVDEVEFLLLNELNEHRNLRIPYCQYDPFDLDTLSDDECWAEFRFKKNDIHYLVDVLQLPDEIITYNRLKVDPAEGACILLKRLAYPCRYLDMVARFARPVAELCVIANHIMTFIHDRWGFLLNSFNRAIVNPESLERYAMAIHARGAPLTNCWGFVDGTVRPISRPGNNQRMLYNGHKRVHAIKFQSVATPDGLVAFLHGPYEGRRHDSGILRESGLMNMLQEHSVSQNGEVMCIYGDSAYPYRPQLQAPFKGANLTADQEPWNIRMSSCRISVEWLFGDIVNYFKFIDFKKNLKIQLSAIGKMYIVATLLKNARNCLYGSITSDYFALEPPLLQNYFTEF